MLEFLQKYGIVLAFAAFFLLMFRFGRRSGGCGMGGHRDVERKGDKGSPPGGSSPTDMGGGCH